MDGKILDLKLNLKLAGLLEIMEEKIEEVEGVYGDIDYEEYLWFLGVDVDETIHSIHKQIIVTGIDISNTTLEKILSIKRKVDFNNRSRISLFREVIFA